MGGLLGFLEFDENLIFEKLVGVKSVGKFYWIFRIAGVFLQPFQKNFLLINPTFIKFMKQKGIQIHPVIIPSKNLGLKRRILALFVIIVG